MIRLVFTLLILTLSVSSLRVLAQTPTGIDAGGGVALQPDLNLPLVGEVNLTPALPLEPDLIETPSWAIEVADSDCCDGLCQPSSGCLSCQHSVASHWTPWQGMHFHPGVDWSRFCVGERFRAGRTRDRGIGYERVMFAPQVLDTAIATPHVGLRYQIDSGLRVPDRAEYYWAAGSAGPSAPQAVNAQDLSVRLAVGNEKAMAHTQYTLRSLDPDLAANTTGMGDMIVGAQALLRDGKRLKLATIFRTYIATGTASRGLGTGHTSLEPGLLARYCWAPETYLFGEVKYWMPIKGTSGTSGDVLSTGWGISAIASESDVYAFLPTLEIRTLTFLFGGERAFDGSNVSTRSIDGLTAVELYPGARFVLGPQTDLGLCEFGCAAGITIADDEWFDTRWVFDIRWSK